MYHVIHMTVYRGMICNLTRIADSLSVVLTQCNQCEHKTPFHCLAEVYRCYIVNWLLDHKNFQPCDEVCV